MAAAVAGVFARPVAARATPRTRAAEPAGTRSRACKEDGDAAVLLDTLRAARSAQRRRKKERRRAAKAAAASTPPQKDGAGGLDTGLGGASDSVPALAPTPSAAPTPPAPSADGGHTADGVGSYAPTPAPSLVSQPAPPSSAGGMFMHLRKNREDQSAEHGSKGKDRKEGRQSG